MKSINKLFGIFMALCLLLGGAACTDEVEYTGAELQNANQPYFPTNLASKIDLSADATSFTVEVSRLATGTELTVDLVKSGDDAGLFTVPATATFAADAMTAAITIGYDPAKFELDVYNPLTITIATEGLDNPYSSNTYSFTAGIPAPYETIGEATFADAGYFTDTFFKVELQQISGITSKNGRNDAKRLNIRVVTVSNDDKPKKRKTQRKADLRRRMVCKSLPVKE